MSKVRRSGGRPAHGPRIPFQKLDVPRTDTTEAHATVRLPLKDGAIDFQRPIEARVSQWLQAEEDQKILELMAQGFRYVPVEQDGEIEWVLEVLKPSEQLAAIRERAAQAQRFLEMALKARGAADGGAGGSALSALRARVEAGETV